MKIDPQHSASASKGANPVDRPAGGGRGGGVDAGGQGNHAAGAQGGDRLVVSSQGDRFRQLRARLADLPEPPAQSPRVTELTALVASGRYQLEGNRIAQGLLADEATAGVLGLPQAG